jgi:hypothetical protein
MASSTQSGVFPGGQCRRRGHHGQLPQRAAACSCTRRFQERAHVHMWAHPFCPCAHVECYPAVLSSLGTICRSCQAMVTNEFEEQSRQQIQRSERCTPLLFVDDLMHTVLGALTPCLEQQLRCRHRVPEAQRQQRRGGSPRRGNCRSPHQGHFYSVI